MITDYADLKLTMDDRFQDMTETEIAFIYAAHALLTEIKNSPRENKYDPVQAIEDIEFALQHTWGFTRDKSFHSHWIDIKGCTCPRLDNMERRGVPYRIINATCPWHSVIKEST